MSSIYYIAHSNLNHLSQYLLKAYKMYSGEIEDYMDKEVKMRVGEVLK